MSDVQLTVQLTSPNIIEVTTDSPNVVEVKQDAPIRVEVSDVPRIAVNIPPGGNTNEVLTKASNTNFDYTWRPQTGGGASQDKISNGAFQLSITSIGGIVFPNGTTQITAYQGYGIDNAATSLAIAAYNAANSSVTDYSPAFNKANSAYDISVAAFDAANNAITDYSPAFIKANSANYYAHLVDANTIAAFDKANTASIEAIAAFGTANAALANTDGATFNGSLRVIGTLSIGTSSVTITGNTVSAAAITVDGTNVVPSIVASYNQANTANYYAFLVDANTIAAFNKANTANYYAHLVDANTIAVFDKANSNYAYINTVDANGKAAFAQANAATTGAGAAFDKANTANYFAYLVNSNTTAAFAKANSANYYVSLVDANVTAAFAQANSGIISSGWTANAAIFANVNGYLVSRPMVSYSNANSQLYVAGTIRGTPAAIANDTISTSLGYMGIPQNSQASGYTLALTDQGKQIYVTSNSTITIPANSSVSFPIGTTVVLITPASITANVAITTDTLYLAGIGTTGTRTVLPYGAATLIKVTNTTWYISGAGVG